MTDVAEEVTEAAPEMDELRDWRESVFRRLGIPEDDVVALARSAVDTHAVADLVQKRKCPVHLVRPILL